MSKDREHEIDLAEAEANTLLWEVDPVYARSLGIPIPAKAVPRKAPERSLLADSLRNQQMQNFQMSQMLNAPLAYQQQQMVGAQLGGGLGPFGQLGGILGGLFGGVSGMGPGMGQEIGNRLDRKLKR
jgi:hypothetical protein